MTFTTLATIPRDRLQRPLVIPPGGGKPKAYSRVTTYIDCVEDKYKIQQWEKRMVLLGTTDREDIQLSAAAHRDDKTHLDMLAEAAKEYAKAHAAATVGTAVHKLAETYDRGLPVGAIPGDYQRDLDAYITETAGMTHLCIEEFMVHDQMKVGGTPDRIVSYEGHTYIADIKTGSIEWGALKIAMQLAVYSRSERYDPATGDRIPQWKGIAVDQDRAIVIHLPAGTGRCELHWVDIAKGWAAVHTATAVREWRKVKGLLTSMTPDRQLQAAAAPYIETVDAAIMAPLPDEEPTDEDLFTVINRAGSVAHLEAIWQYNEADWTDAHTAAAVARKQALTEPPIAIATYFTRNG